MHKIEYPLEQAVEPLTVPFVSELQSYQKEIYQAFDKFDLVVSQVRKRVREQITEQEKFWFQESYKLFEEAEICETTDTILYSRQTTPSENTLLAEETLRARLSNYADWRFSGMIIRPGMETFIDNMVGCDPLYIVDRDHDLLRPCLERFPKLYQNRVRPYTVNDWSDEPLLGKIPNNQFGVCLAYNVFNFRPLEIIRRYLKEIYDKLRPGGVLFMTYNDCDFYKAVMLVENFYASYTPGYLIRDLAEALGFELIYSWSDGGPSVWLELRKPGTLVSLRGGQAIARILSKHSYLDDVDFLKRKTYSKEEINQLREQARELGINGKIIKRSQPYELQVVINETLEEKDQLYRAEREKQRIEHLTNLAKQYKIDTNDPNWEELVKLAQLKELAVSHGIDITRDDWQYMLDQALIEKEKERKRLEEEERRQVAEAERLRIMALHERARSYNIDPLAQPNEAEIMRLIAEAVDQQKKQELKQLRQKAMELDVGDPNLIRYGYSAEKLKQLIKEKEEAQR